MTCHGCRAPGNHTGPLCWASGFHAGALFALGRSLPGARSSMEPWPGIRTLHHPGALEHNGGSSLAIWSPGRGPPWDPRKPLFPQGGSRSPRLLPLPPPLCVLRAPPTGRRWGSPVETLWAHVPPKGLREGTEGSTKATLSPVPQPPYLQESPAQCPCREWGLAPCARPESRKICAVLSPT